jgi:hypothetical protein
MQRAIDRIIQELQRLKSTPGLKSDFDRVLAAYTKVRQEIDREIQGRVDIPAGPAPAPAPAFPLRPPNFARPRPPAPPVNPGQRFGPMGPRGRFRGR